MLHPLYFTLASSLSLYSTSRHARTHNQAKDTHRPKIQHPSPTARGRGRPKSYGPPSRPSLIDPLLECFRRRRTPRERKEGPEQKEATLQAPAVTRSIGRTAQRRGNPRAATPPPSPPQPPPPHLFSFC
jgi:hypothetical protein